MEYKITIQKETVQTVIVNAESISEAEDKAINEDSKEITAKQETEWRVTNIKEYDKKDTEIKTNNLPETKTTINNALEELYHLETLTNYQNNTISAFINWLEKSNTRLK